MCASIQFTAVAAASFFKEGLTPLCVGHRFITMQEAQALRESWEKRGDSRVHTRSRSRRHLRDDVVSLPLDLLGVVGLAPVVRVRWPVPRPPPNPSLPIPPSIKAALHFPPLPPSHTVVVRLRARPYSSSSTLRFPGWCAVPMSRRA